MPRYTIFDVMLRDIVGFMRSTGVTDIRSADNTIDGIIGYSTRYSLDTITWTIPVEAIQGVTREALRTGEGRARLLRNLVQASREGVVTPLPPQAQPTPSPARLDPPQVPREPVVAGAPRDVSDDPEPNYTGVPSNEYTGVLKPDRRTAYDLLEDDDF